MDRGYNGFDISIAVVSDCDTKVQVLTVASLPCGTVDGGIGQDNNRTEEILKTIEETQVKKC